MEKSVIENLLNELKYTSHLVNLIDRSKKISKDVRTDVCVKTYFNTGINYLNKTTKKFRIIPYISLIREEMHQEQMKETEDTCKFLIEEGYAQSDY